MNIQKPVTIILAILINVAALAWFHDWSTSVAANAAAMQRADKIVTLPTITVRPTRAQMELLQRKATPDQTSTVIPSGDGSVQALVMPYYSFADEPETVSKG